MKELPVNVVMYQLENNYYIYRLDNRKIRALFVNIISKVKRVPNVKIITIPDNLVPNIATTRIMCLTEKNKIVKHYLISIGLISRTILFMSKFK